METLADVTLRMTEGEMLQTRYEGRIDLTEEEYLGLVERKTAALFGACCELAAIIAGVDEPRRRTLRQSGIQLGIAFQLIDDLLDFTGDAKVLGKPAASDLREGKVTLALIDLMGGGSRQARDLARTIMDTGKADSPEIAELGELLEESGAIERTRKRAHSHAERAIAGLELFEDGPERRALSSVADLLVFRER
jgi:octaprenyl-diphosphate synthase